MEPPSLICYRITPFEIKGQPSEVALAECLTQPRRVSRPSGSFCKVPQLLRVEGLPKTQFENLTPDPRCHI
jgi:hypothetical protein